MMGNSTTSPEEPPSNNCTLESPSVIAMVDVADSVLLPFIAVFGILGNLFSIAIFQHGTKLKRLASTVYLTGLSVSDTIFLFTLLLSTPALGILSSRVMCKVIIYFMNVSGVFSSWLVVMFTVERFIVIAFPLTHVARCSSRSRARCLVMFMLPLPTLMYVYTAVVLIDVDQQGICRPKDEYLVVVTILHCVELSFTYFLPAFIVVALNVRIGVQLIRSSIERREMRSGSLSAATEQAVAMACRAVVPDSPYRNSSNNNNNNTHHHHQHSTTTTNHNNRLLPRSERASGGGLANHQEARRSRVGSSAGNHHGGTISSSSTSSNSTASENAITRTLIVISTAFALLNLPHNAVLLVKLCAQLTGIGQCFARSDFMYVLTSVCYALYYANFGVNIVVYHMTSSNYREEAKDLSARLSACFSTIGRRLLLKPPLPYDPSKFNGRYYGYGSSIGRNGLEHSARYLRSEITNSSRSTTPVVCRRTIQDSDPMLLNTITEVEVVSTPFLARAS